MPSIINIKDAKPTLKNVIINPIRNKIRNDYLNHLTISEGPTGCGKSLSDLKKCIMVDPDFNVERCAFTIDQFIKICKPNGKALKAGSAILFDESGTKDAIGNRNFMARTQKTFLGFTQSFRSMRFYVAYNAPKKSMIDLQIRQLCHQQYSFVSKAKKRKVTIWKVYNNAFKNYAPDKPIGPHPVILRDGIRKRVPMVEIGLPPKWLIRDYSKLKNENIAKIMDNVGKQEKKATQEEIPIKERLEKYINQVWENQKHYMNKHTNTINLDMLNAEFKGRLPRVECRYIKNVIDKRLALPLLDSSK